MSKKTVFILGAGFSYDAGIPLQGELLSTILDYNFPDKLDEHRKPVVDFIKNVFGLKKSQSKDLALEDIYTPLHQSISKNEYLKKYSPEELKKIENSLNLLISHVIDEGREGFSSNSEYVNAFIELLINNKRKKTTDHFSVFSLNWDILLDKRIFTEINNEGVIDYACHCVGFREDRMLPPLVAKERGLFTIKLLKLHGSLNWVTCPKCRRLFVNKRGKEGMRSFEEKLDCRFCRGVKLNAALLLPSFKKDFEKFHFQSIWNQAAIELSEATKIVFMGYSFPLADYDFRSLITKHVGKVKVDVVLKSSDEKENEEEKRYKGYFGDKIQRIYYDGVADYITNHMAI